MLFVPILSPKESMLQCKLSRGNRVRRGTCCHDALCDILFSGAIPSSMYNENDEDDHDYEFSEIAHNL